MTQKTPTYPRGSGGTIGAFNAKPPLANRRANLKYSVSTTSTTSKGVVPIKGATKYPTEPSIYFTREAWVKQCHLVDKCNKEVGWFALVDYAEADNSFTITELVIPKQEVTAAETDIGKEDLADAAMELIEQGKDTGKLYAWFHSHVNMGVSPSGQDEYQVEEYLEDLADQPEVPAFIRGIQNKQGDLKLDVYYIQHGVAYQNVNFYVIHDDDPQWLTDIETEITSKVTERTYGAYNGYYGYGSGGNRQQTGKSQSAPRSVARDYAATNANGFRDRGYDGPGYNGYDWDTYYGLDDYDATDVGVEMDADNPAADAPLPATISQSAYNAMEVVYASPSNMEVMLCKDGKLWVCDEKGDMFHYEDYVACYGEIDGDTHQNKYTSIPVN